MYNIIDNSSVLYFLTLCYCTTGAVYIPEGIRDMCTEYSISLSYYHSKMLLLPLLPDFLPGSLFRFCHVRARVALPILSKIPLV